MNILFHILFHVPDIITGALCTVLEVFLIWGHRLSFCGLFAAKPLSEN